MQGTISLSASVPRMLEDILARRKTVELRRRFPVAMGAGGLMLIYASRPEQSLIGAARIERCEAHDTRSVCGDRFRSSSACPERHIQ